MSSGFKTPCRTCGVEIWMSKQSNGKWLPHELLDGGDSGEMHKHREKPKPDSGQPTIEQSSKEQQNIEALKQTGKLIPEAEQRVREIVREELALVLGLAKELVEAKKKQ
jgi:hypothetical protein